MSDANWASLLTKPEKVANFDNSKLIYYHGVVAQAYYNNDQMLPGGYISAIRNLYLKLNEELMNRLEKKKELQVEII